MATTKVNHRTEWNNYHFNGPFPNETVLDILTDKTIPSLIDRYNDCTQEIQRQIKICIETNKRLRAFGSRWSLSNIAHQQDKMFFISRLNIKKEISPDFLLNPANTKAENLFFFQCGTTVKEITEYISKKGKSLKTSGASNGQTIAGAISTGVHGSAIDVGSIQDSIVGINLIVGPGENDVLYVERASVPVLNDNFGKTLKSKMIRNDDIFNTILVGLGSCGIIHGVVIEVEDLFLLKRYVRKIKRPVALQLAESMDFVNTSFEINLKGGSILPKLKPYHYKLYINPYNDDEFVTEIIYKEPYRTNYPNPINLIQKSIFKDLPTWIAFFASRFQFAVPAIVQELQGDVFPTIDDDIEGTLGELFWDTSQSSKAISVGFGINHTDCGFAYELFKNLMISEGPIPAILSMRFVKKSEATLAFTKFPTTCILELDGIPWESGHGLVTLNEFLVQVINSFKNNGIAFTLHWGKNAPWGEPNLVNSMYGATADKWQKNRSVILTEPMADLFSNDFLNSVNLSNYVNSLPPTLIALRDEIQSNIG
jgi:hypothetical protein